MGKRTSFEHGIFSWVDLATSDQEGAKSFYSELFGWNFEDMPAGDQGTYSMAKHQGSAVGALYTMQEEMKSQGIPPHWQSYITVKDVAECSNRVKGLGGEVIAPPFDVMDAGMMAVIKDPSGAVVNLWQAKAHHGAELVNDPGSFCWNELNTRDVPKAQQFFKELLGWSFDEEKEPMPYTTIKNGDRMNGGMVDITQMAPPEVPASWMVYFAVKDTDAHIAKAKSMGANLILEPVDLPAGRFAVLQDPQGAVFSIIDLPNAED